MLDAIRFFEAGGTCMYPMYPTIDTKIWYTPAFTFDMISYTLLKHHSVQSVCLSLCPRWHFIFVLVLFESHTFVLLLSLLLLLLLLSILHIHFFRNTRKKMIYIVSRIYFINEFSSPFFWDREKCNYLFSGWIWVLVCAYERKRIWWIGNEWEITIIAFLCVCVCVTTLNPIAPIRHEQWSHMGRDEYSYDKWWFQHIHRIYRLVLVAWLKFGMRLDLIWVKFVSLKSRKRKTNECNVIVAAEYVYNRI